MYQMRDRDRKEHTRALAMLWSVEEVFSEESVERTLNSEKQPNWSQGINDVDEVSGRATCVANYRTFVRCEGGEPK